VTERLDPATALLDLLPPTTFVVGKGGVGKTTCAAGIAMAFAKRGEPTLLVSTDPAAALGLVLDAPIGPDPTQVPDRPLLRAQQLSPNALRADFIAQWGSVITDIVDRGTYLDRDDIAGIVENAFPGADEIFAVLALAELLDARRGERVVVDTAPTGHTLRLLQLPATWHAVVKLMDAMQEKHRFMVRALTHRYRTDRADEFLREMRRRAESFVAALADPARVGAVLVTRPDPVVDAESARFAAALKEMGLSVRAVIVNAAETLAGDSEVQAPVYAPDAQAFSLPHAGAAPRNAREVERLMGRLQPLTRRRASGARNETRFASETNHESGGGLHPQALLQALLRTFTIVGGKGGVGKTSVACALAVSIASETTTTLLVSTDPAPSIADALGRSGADWHTFAEDEALEAVPGLVVRQMDAAAAFARLRDEYQRQVDAVFDAIVSRGIDAAADRAIVRDLLALAPPGIDEVYALSMLGDAIASGRFARVIVDPAPTGHLLRLLEMPALAIEWSHRLLRLMLKYKDITGLGDAAQELLSFAKRTRMLQALLADPDKAGLLVVALDEPVVRAESERLVAQARARGVTQLGVLWNRASPSVSPLPSSIAARQYCAPHVAPPPVGIGALRHWAAQWRTVTQG